MFHFIYETRLKKHFFGPDSAYIFKHTIIWNAFHKFKLHTFLMQNRILLANVQT